MNLNGCFNSESHTVFFYDHPGLLHSMLARSINPAIEAGEGILLVATEATYKERSYKSDRISFLDAHHMLSLTLKGDVIDKEVFHRLIGERLRELNTSFQKSHCFVDMADLLCGDHQAKLSEQLEKLWREVLVQHSNIKLYCSFQPKSRPLPAVNALTAEMAHQLNTPLTTIRLVTEQLMDTIANEALPDALEMVLRLREIDKATEQVASINKAIEQLRAKTPHVLVRLNLPPTPMTCKVDPEQLAQVFLYVLMTASTEKDSVSVNMRAHESGDVEAQFVGCGKPMSTEALEYMLMGRSVSLTLAGAIARENGAQIRIANQDAGEFAITLILPVEGDLRAK